MSEGFTSQSLGAKTPVAMGEHERLRQGALGLIDIAAATMANIGPAMSFYFGFGFLAYTAGLASPLTIVAAGIAILFLGNTLSEFTKVLPSTGGFISFIGKTFGGRTGGTTAILVGLGYIGAWGLGHVLGGHATSATMSALTMFVESSTFGTILLLLVYGLSNLALPFYYKKHHPELFNTFRHGVLPSLGVLSILVPIYYLAKPGQPTPFNWYPYMALGV